jgi:hypothetical protein
MSATDIYKLALVYLEQTRAQVPGALPVLLVHDEVVIEADEAQDAAVVAWAEAAFRRAGERYLRRLPVTVSHSTATRWGELPLTNAPPAALEQDAARRADAILACARRLRTHRALPLDEAEGLLETYKAQIADWRRFTAAHTAQCPAIGERHARLLDEVAALRRQLREEQAHGEVER